MFQRLPEKLPGHFRRSFLVGVREAVFAGRGVATDGGERLKTNVERSEAGMDLKTLGCFGLSPAASEAGNGTIAKSISLRAKVASDCAAE
jgi:hypothetical protein